MGPLHGGRRSGSATRRPNGGWLGAGALFAFCAFLASALPAASKTYCLSIDYSAVPALVNYKIITVNMNVGACGSVSVTANGVAIPASYTASTQTASFSTSGTAIVVTALNWTAGGTGAATKATLYNNYQWAYSQTFDDVRETQYQYAKPILDGLGLKAGLSAVGSWLEGGNDYYQTFTQLLAFMADGWDVYNHTWDHPDPVTCDTFVTEFGQNQTAFLSEITGYNVTHAVFPYEVSVATCAGYPPNYIISGELDDGPAYTHVATPLTAANTLTVARNGIYGVDGAVLPAIEANCSNAANDATASWVIYITHSVTEGDGAAADEYSTNQNTLSTLYNYLLTNWGPAGNNSMWFAPSGTVQDYLFTRDNCVLTTCAAPSATPTPLSSATSTGTATPTGSPTPSLTRTPSPSGTPSPSRTASPTATGSATPSASATASPSPTGSASASATKTATPLATASFSGTVTVSSTPAASASATPSDSTTPSLTATAPATPTLTASASPAVSPSASATPSLTATAATPTLTASSSPLPSPTPTPSGSATPSLSATASPTLSATPSPSETVTAAATASDTPTRPATPTLSATAVPSAAPSSTPVRPSATASPSADASPAQGPLVIVGLAPVPNPDPNSIAIDMAGPGDRVVVTVYTTALVLARIFSSQETLSPGWQLLSLDGLFNGLPTGLYFVQATVWRGSIESAPKTTKIYLLK